jgi:hypothetical protein
MFRFSQTCMPIGAPDSAHAADSAVVLAVPPREHTPAYQGEICPQEPHPGLRDNAVELLPLEPTGAAVAVACPVELISLPAIVTGAAA